jgi:nucleotide-binding universal stress UspA family protein
VVAHAADVPAEYLESSYYEEMLGHSRERAREVLDAALARLDGDAEVQTAVLSGPPARSLVELSHEVGADDIAVGSRGFGKFRAAALGSTSHALLHESDLPVLLITRRALERSTRRPPAARPQTIVVGYDGSAGAKAALEYAVALDTGPDSRVVVTYAYAAPPDWFGFPNYEQALQGHQLRGQRLLRELEERGIATGELEIELIEGPPADALVRLAHGRDAHEIIVGSRGLGRFRAALGSVSHELLHEADLPLVVVPAADRDRGAKTARATP